MEVDRNGLEVLTRDECLDLIATATLGRVGLTSGALPVVLPVNFRLLGDRIFIRTGHGTKLDAAVSDAVVAFEVDDFDPMDHTGWSVMITGRASEVDPEAEPVLDREILPRWAPQGNGRVISISTELVSGRRIHR